MNVETGNPVVLAAALLLSFASVADRVETQVINWTCDGEKVTVPHTWNAVDGADGHGGRFQDFDNSVAGRGFLRCCKTYATTLPASVPGKRYFVRCDGAAVVAMVCVNGRIVGTHRGAVTAFAFEITRFMKEHDNLLEIVVDNHFDELQPPVYGDYTIEGGLYRPVWLIETDPICIDPTYYGGPGVELDADPDTGTVTAKVHVLGGKDQVQKFHFENHRLWSPEEPNLYDVAITITNGTWRDTVHQKVGFRKAEFRDDGFYLNGVRRQLRGVNYHQEREGAGWALTREDIDADLNLIKDMGADSMRGTHYPHSRICYDLCDEKGILCWVEVPASALVWTNAIYVSRLMDTAREMIAQNRNHPSLLVWSLYNELYSVWDGQKEDMKRSPIDGVIKGLQNLFSDLDPSHPTTGAWCSYTEGFGLEGIVDVAASNCYPGWKHNEPDRVTRRIDRFFEKAGSGKSTVGIGEYGAFASIYHHSDPYALSNDAEKIHAEEWQVAVHHDQYACIKRDPRVWGSFIWMMFDAASDNREEGDHKGINDKGLVTHDHHTTKDAYHFYRTNWNTEPTVYLCSKRMVEVGERFSVVGFTNCGKASLFVNGRLMGECVPDSVNTVIWKDVPFEMGLNVVEIRAGKVLDRCTWLRRNSVHKDRFATKVNL